MGHGEGWVMVKDESWWRTWDRTSILYLLRIVLHPKYEFVTWHKWMHHITPVNERYVQHNNGSTLSTRMNEWCCTHEWVMPHICTRHVEWVMPHACIIDTYAWDMSRIWIRKSLCVRKSLTAQHTTYANIFTYMHWHIYTQIYKYTQTKIYTFAHSQANTHTQSHTHTHKYT